jgi:transposase InsO family protein
VFGLLSRAIARFNGQDIEFRRVMSDNGPAYASRAFNKAYHTLGLLLIRTRPYRPSTNGKEERFIQTISREWANAMASQNSEERNRWLPLYLAIYILLKQHSALRCHSLQRRLVELRP